MAYMQAVRLIQRDAWKLLSVDITVGIGYFGIYAVVFNLYLLRLGYGTAFVGALNGMAFLIAAIFAIPAGMIGRKIGLRGAMLTGYLIWFAASVLLPMTEWIAPESRALWLYTIFTAKWCGAILYGVNYIPYLVAVTGKQERTHAFSIANAIHRASAFAGSLLAGLLPIFFAEWFGLSLDSTAPYFYTLCLAPLLYLIGLPILWSIRPVSSAGPQQSHATTPLPTGLFITVALFLVLIVAADAAATTFFNVYMDEALFVPTVTIGLFMGVAQLAAIPAALFAPILVMRWGSFRVILAGVLITVLSTLVLAYATTAPIAGLGYVGIVGLVGILIPVRNIFHQEITETEWRSTMSGVAKMAETVGRAAMVSSGGFIIAAVGYQSMFVLAAFVTFLGGVLFWSFFRQPRKAAVETSLAN